MRKTEGVLLGMLVAVIFIVACGAPKSKLESDNSAKARQFEVKYSSRTTPIITEELGKVGWYTIFSMKKDGVEYLIVADNNGNGGVSIIKHEPMVRPKVNMDSVVANSVWIDEYAMLGYTQAKPSKESLESLTNPEVRPVPVGTEKEFVEHHSTPEM